MTKSYIETLPAALQNIYDDEVADMHEQLQAEKAQDVLSRRSNTEIIRATRETAAHAVVEPHLHEVDYLSPVEGVVSPYPLAIGLSKQMFTRSETTANFTGMRALAFLNSDHKSRGLTLTGDERSMVSMGDLEPIVDRYARVIEGLGWTTVHVAGYSQGGMMAPALAEALVRKGVADVPTVMASEWPNGQARSFKELMDAFGKTKPEDIKNAISSSEIEAFSEVANAGDGTLPWMKSKAGLLMYLAGNLRQPNLSLISAMGKGNFNAYLQQYLEREPESHVLLARAGLSAILTEAIFARNKEKFASDSRVTHLEIDGFDHAFGDFAVGEALLVRKSTGAVLA